MNLPKSQSWQMTVMDACIYSVFFSLSLLLSPLNLGNCVSQPLGLLTEVAILSPSHSHPQKLTSSAFLLAIMVGLLMSK